MFILILASCNLPLSTPSPTGTPVPFIPRSASTSNAVTLLLTAEPKTVVPGTVFDVNVQISSGEQLVDTAQASINFDPKYLEVIEIVPGTELPTELVRAYDNQSGTIDYAHGALPPAQPAKGLFTLATVKFRAKTEISTTQISFNQDLPRQSGIFYQGGSVQTQDPPLSLAISIQKEPVAIIPTFEPTAKTLLEPSAQPTAQPTTQEKGQLTPQPTAQAKAVTPSTAVPKTKIIDDWTVEIIPAPSEQLRLSEHSLRLDNKNNPYLAFGYNHLYFAFKEDEDWLVETVDDRDKVGEYASLALNSNRVPFISYFDRAKQDLKYATKINGKWERQRIDKDGDVGMFSSIAVDKNNQPHIAYFDDDHDQLKYARWNGSDWIIQVVDNKSRVGLYASLGLNGADIPRIAYYDIPNHDLKYAIWLKNSYWGSMTVTQNGDVGKYSSLAVDNTGYPCFAYFDEDKDAMMYTRFNGKSWTFWTVDDDGRVGINPSLRIDKNNQPHIVYQDIQTHELRYAYFTNGSWKTSVLDGLGTTKTPTSLAIDTSLQPHIAFFDMNENVIKYAVLDK